MPLYIANLYSVYIKSIKNLSVGAESYTFVGASQKTKVGELPTCPSGWSLGRGNHEPKTLGKPEMHMIS